MAEPGGCNTAALEPALLEPLGRHRAALLAVSGGADSTALMVLAARWHAAGGACALSVATVDHGLRPQARAECEQVAAMAGRLGLPCEILRWRDAHAGPRLQERARAARYDLLVAAALRRGASALVTGHTLDDQAETVLMRLAHGSGIDGLAAMRAEARRGTLVHLRPLLDVPKARLVAMLRSSGIEWIEDPSNADPRFERARLRTLAPVLARAGLDAARLAVLARRAARATDALDAGAQALLDSAGQDGPALRLPLAAFAAAPAELRLRALALAVERRSEAASAYPPRLERLEALLEAVDAAIAAGQRLRRTLGGCVVTVAAGGLSIAPEPPRRRPLIARKADAGNASPWLLPPARLD